VTLRSRAVVDSNSSNRFAAGSIAVIWLAGLRSAIFDAIVPIPAPTSRIR
jgi:hypothetical protein